MALMTWNNSYSVKVQKIDDQHHILFDMLNELHAAMMKGEAQRVTGLLLHKLADYTNVHFTAEEAMMAAAKYPALADHKLKHRELIKQVEDYVLKYDQGDVSLNVKLLDFLNGWLVNHIQKVDMAYSACLLKNGIK